MKDLQYYNPEQKAAYNFKQGVAEEQHYEVIQLGESIKIPLSAFEYWGFVVAFSVAALVVAYIGGKFIKAKFKRR